MVDENCYYLSKEFVEKNWLPSIGGTLTKDHFREKPPWTGHAECDSSGEFCRVHEDEVNPHEDPVGHLVADSPETLVELGVATASGIITYKRTQDVWTALQSATFTGIASYVIIEIAKGILGGD